MVAAAGMESAMRRMNDESSTLESAEPEPDVIQRICRLWIGSTLLGDMYYDEDEDEGEFQGSTYSVSNALSSEKSAIMNHNLRLPSSCFQ